jgi:ABC-type nickel/cobalt efflux system permease component RcnA
VALASHGLKAGTRALLNTSPEPASNWAASVAEDGVVIAGLALALAHPWLALALVVGASLLGALTVWLVWRTLWRGVKRLFAAPAPAAAAATARDHSLPPAR